MHLKFDNRLFSFLFYMGLVLAVFVYAVALATFHFFLSRWSPSFGRSVRGDPDAEFARSGQRALTVGGAD